MIANSDKTKCIHFTGTAQITFPPDLLLENVNSHKELGVYVEYGLKWNHHVTKKLHMARQSFFAMKSEVLFNTPSNIKLQLYHSMMLSILIFASQLGILTLQRAWNLFNVSVSPGFLYASDVTKSTSKDHSFCLFVITLSTLPSFSSVHFYNINAISILFVIYCFRYPNDNSELQVPIYSAI